MEKDEWRPTALVSGASRGIGRDLARVFAREGHDVVVLARSGRELRDLAGELERDHAVRVEVVEQDLLRPDAAERVHRAVAGAGIEVDVLVNNAGFGTWGPFLDADLERQIASIRLNVVALTALTGRFLPGMVERGRGGVLNVASTAAFQPGPLMAVYYAGKAFVLHFSEALAEELRESAVRVTALCPGPTRTAFHERAGMGDVLLLRTGTMEAAEVAEAGYRGFRRGRRIVVPGALNRLGVFLNRISPRSVVTRVVRELQERRGSGRGGISARRGPEGG